MSYSVLPDSFSGGPHGLGDPDDKTLRKVETEILIPQRLRDRAKVEKCKEEVTEFETCGKLYKLLFPFYCRKENDKLKSCLGEWYHDTQYVKQITDEYLEIRSEYRRTGVGKKVKTKRVTVAH